MIRLRKADGSATEISSEDTFVELVNDKDGSVMMVFVQLTPGVLLQVKPGTVDASRYETMFARHGVVFSKTMIVREAQ